MNTNNAPELPASIDGEANKMMTVPEILKELEPYTGRFPMQAMKAAIEQREAITPELLRVLEAVADNPAEWAKKEDCMLHLFALFLLAQFREKRAYPLAVNIVSAPGEVPFDLFGDTVTEALCQIFGSIYDGDPAPLEMLVENEAVNEFVRGAAIETFLVLERSGQMPREQVIAYFQRLFCGKLERNYSNTWNVLVSAVADMHAPELLEEVRRAYADGLVESVYSSLEGIERALRFPKESFRDRHHVITDAIAELEWWASFNEDSNPTPMPTEELKPSEATPFSRPAYVAPTPLAAPKPFVAAPKIGRNDPCPCGSGKKYKKCCG